MFDVKKMGNTIRKLRGDKSQDEVATALHISRGSLSYYENGDRKPDADVLYAMSEYFGVPSDYIIGRSDVSKYDTDLQAVCEYTGLSQEVVEKLHRDMTFIPSDNSFITDGLNTRTQVYRNIVNDVLSSKEFNYIIYGLEDMQNACTELTNPLPKKLCLWSLELSEDDVNSSIPKEPQEQFAVMFYTMGIEIAKANISAAVQAICEKYDTRANEDKEESIKKIAVWGSLNYFSATPPHAKGASDNGNNKQENE